MLPSLTHPTPTADQLNGSGVQAEYFSKNSAEIFTQNDDAVTAENENMKRDQTIKLHTDA